MPRKKPDLTPWIKEKEGTVDSVFARMLYFNEWGTNYVLRMKDNPETQRTVHCNDCGIVIPRDVPRLAREGSWYNKGSICMECGEKQIKQFLASMEQVEKTIMENKMLAQALLDCANEVVLDPRYEDKLCMGKMLQTIGGARRRR